VRLFLEELMALPALALEADPGRRRRGRLLRPQQGESSALEAILDVNGRGRKRGYRLC
jgi:hypothetical protein